MTIPQYLLDSETEVVEPVYQLIQRGRDFLLYGNNTEGIALLVCAYVQLAAEASPIVNLLETIINAYTRYNKTQEALLHASREYIKAETEWQVQLGTLANLFTTQDKQNIIATSLLHHQLERQGALSRDNTIEMCSLSSTLSSTLCTTQSDYLPGLSITCFRQFVVQRAGHVVTLCRSRKGQTILRYLITQQSYCASADMLMEALWPDEEPETARRKLQIAVSSLRCSLNHGYDCNPGGGYILCKNQLYQLNPLITFLTDVDEFLALYQSGQHANRPDMISKYERACHLYRGPFLTEDLYADWSMRRREQLIQVYLTMCSTLSSHFLKVGKYEYALHWAKATLEANRCDEEAHQNLMRAYAALGRRRDALRQYHSCEQMLLEELNVAPMPETVQVYQDICSNQTLSPQEEK